MLVVVLLVVGFVLAVAVISGVLWLLSSQSPRPAAPSKSAAASAKPAEPKPAEPSVASRVASAAPVTPEPGRSSLASIPEPEPIEEDWSMATGPHKRILVSAVGMTDPGLRREHNEDAYVCLPTHNMFAIADGMGMHAAGEVASRLTIENITDAFQKGWGLEPPTSAASEDRRSRLVNIIRRANDLVLASSKKVLDYRGMGTTVVLAHFSPSKQKVYIAHVGDSRCYRLRRDKIEQLTVDHTFGNIGITGARSAVLSRAVGVEPDVDVDVLVEPAEVGDVYLLCSDGLSRMVSDEKIFEVVRAHEDLNDASRELIRLANQAGGRDNVTTILVRIDPAPAYGLD